MASDKITLIKEILEEGIEKQNFCLSLKGDTISVSLDGLTFHSILRQDNDFYLLCEELLCSYKRHRISDNELQI